MSSVADLDGVGRMRIPPATAQTVSDPDRLAERTPGHLVGDLHAAFGRHAARAVHAKGTILTGTFEPSPEAAGLCGATLFDTTVPVIVRFSDFTGLPGIPDTDPHGQPRGLAIKFLLPDGSNYDVVSHSYDGFPVATATEFGDFLLAIAASGPEVLSPTPLERFLAANPAAARFVAEQSPPPQSFATCAYFGVNAFQFTSASGVNHFVRYRFVPEAGEHFLDADTLAQRGAEYLQVEIVERVRAAPVAFSWLGQLAAPEDAIGDPTQRWPETRPLVRLGKLRIESPAIASRAADEALLFLPGSTPPGIAIADPMLTIRNAAYPVSYAERAAPR